MLDSVRRLWIAFRIVFLLGIRSFRSTDYREPSVVNCFQNCIFTWHSQYIDVSDVVEISCELLSELYFYLAFAVSERNGLTTYKLWIAFRIVFLLGIRSFIQAFPRALTVVNCFQNCIFTWHSQFAKATH